MKNIFSRTDESFLGRWWWSIDRKVFLANLALLILGSATLFSAGTPVAERIDLSPYHFFIKQTIFMISGILVIIFTSFLSIGSVKRIAIIGMVLVIISLVLTLLLGDETKGAVRWITILNFRIQPSEFAKPLFAVCCGWLFSRHFENKRILGIWLGCILYLTIALLFLLQPDLGQTVVLTTIWMAQFIVVGLPIPIIIGLLPLSLLGIGGSYFIFDHVRVRIDKWLYPQSGDTYQIQKSLEAFANGGMFGVGPGQGNLKKLLPDVHADFIFSVVGEEMGLMGSLFILGLFVYIIHRIIQLCHRQNHMFIMTTLVGLVTQFAAQTAINISSSIGLIPSKGMTLPFISYGGSSLLAIALAMGIILSLTRKK